MDKKMWPKLILSIRINVDHQMLTSCKSLTQTKNVIRQIAMTTKCQIDIMRPLQIYLTEMLMLG